MRSHQILIVGSGDVAVALESISATLGWRPTVVTALDDAISRLPEAESVVVLSHDEDVDGPALATALTSGASYIGAMGSRRTQARRRDWLLAHGVSAELADSIRGPAGLDIGADTPAEIAVAIVAEIVACRRGAVVGTDALSARSGPIHQDAAPGARECPGENSLP
ncbi:XdhC family protein [Haloechinothrix halophila]|uniref:XdhC family protein n=1 Tax=Haloechinothrix halophila TaxID=1069073 RepID=UPI0004032710|nr:XdhC family protein [Haloechinothrix halophila]